MPKKSWEELADDLREEAQKSWNMGAYFGYEDAGYAYRDSATNAMKLALLCDILSTTDIPVPNVFDPDELKISDNASVLETIWGWKVITNPEGYWDGNDYRSFGSLHERADDALEAAERAVETLKEFENQPDIVSQAQAHMSSAPTANMVTIDFSEKKEFLISKIKKFFSI